jgi:hypothetical protein
MDELAKYIEGSLEERGFCVVLENELERWWSSERIDRGDRESDLHSCARLRGWVVSILNSDSGTRALFEPDNRTVGSH